MCAKKIIFAMLLHAVAKMFRSITDDSTVIFGGIIGMKKLP